MNSNKSYFNPFPPSVPIWHSLSKLPILVLEGIIKEISSERRDYESVDEKSLYVPKNDEKNNSGGKGLELILLQCNDD